MRLLVDIGNSRIKWAYRYTGEMHDAAACRYDKPGVKQSLDDHWQSLPRPQQVHVSCVANPAVMDEVTAWTTRQWNLKPRFARVEKTAHGVINSYKDPERLGIDRWLAMIAVHHARHNTACIIDCGTAITVDALSANGEHMGGIILPGLELMRQSLYATSTAVRPRDTGMKNVTSCLAKSTEEAVTSGCLQAAVGAVERVSRSLENDAGGLVEYFITGGDAGRMMTALSFHPQHEPQLVLQGLAIVAGDDA